MPDARNQLSDNEIEELRKIFYSQAYEIVEDLQEEMLSLEASPGDEDLLKKVKRHVHTLKGDSNSIGLLPIGTLCHRMEDVLARLMNSAASEAADAMDILLASVDAVHRLLSESEAGSELVREDEALRRIETFLGRDRLTQAHATRPARTEYEELQIRDALKRGLRVYEVIIKFDPRCSEPAVAAMIIRQRIEEKGFVLACAPASGQIAQGTAEMHLIVSTEIDPGVVEHQAYQAGMTGSITITELRAVSQAASVSSLPHGGDKKREVLRVDASKVDLIMDLVGELIISRSMIDQALRDIGGGVSPGDAATKLAAANAYMERAVSDLQQGVMKIRMVPIHSVFRKFPKMVRDLAADKSKQVRIELLGGETELDKSIVDVIGEPLAHIIRNAIDHGIEHPADRRAAGKPEESVIQLRAYQEASQIVIDASDDGRGIDREKLKKKAVENGMLNPDEAARLSPAATLDLIFLSGLSTASSVSETSGRGVGMDAVKSATESLKGTVEIETAPGRGTLFRLRLPLTLAVINVLLFELGSRIYAAPLPEIAEVARVSAEDLVTVEGKKTLLLRDQIVSVVELGELLGIPGSGSGKKYVLILEAGARKVGLLIDHLLWQQELVIKAVDDRHTQTNVIAGASILGSGKVVLILNVNAVVKKAVDEEKKKGLVSS